MSRESIAPDESHRILQQGNTGMGISLLAELRPNVLLLGEAMESGDGNRMTVAATESAVHIKIMSFFHNYLFNTQDSVPLVETPDTAMTTEQGSVSPVETPSGPVAIEQGNVPQAGTPNGPDIIADAPETPTPRMPGGISASSSISTLNMDENCSHNLVLSEGFRFPADGTPMEGFQFHADGLAMEGLQFSSCRGRFNYSEMGLSL